MTLEGYKSRTARTRFKMAATFKETMLGLLCGLLVMQGGQLDFRQAAHYGLK